MSWYAEFIADSPAAAKKYIADNLPYVPPGQHAAIAEVLDSIGAAPPGSVVRVKTNGHVGGGGSHATEVTVFQLVREPVAAVVASNPEPDGA